MLLTVLCMTAIDGVANGSAACPPGATESRRFRGVMLSGRAMSDDDFKTLEAWGVTLLRYQMTRNWLNVNTDRDTEEYDHWIDRKLDIFEESVLSEAEKRGMKVVLDLHTPPGGRDASLDMNMFYEEKYAVHFVETWRRIARRFKGRPCIYGYDLINEPSQTRNTRPGMDCIGLQLRAAEAIREEDPRAPVIVESNNWAAPSAFRRMTPLPLTNAIYQIHMYEPTAFTHQRVLKEFPKSAKYPNAEKGWDKDFLRRRLQPVRDFQLKHGARIYVGEFSAVAWAEGAAEYLRDLISIFEGYGWDWSYHAFREWPGWSVEHDGPDAGHLAPSAGNPRKTALLEGFKGLTGKESVK